jgi:hypothetical protein
LEVRSCWTLLDSAQETEKFVGAENAVWLVSDPELEWPLVVNWRERRIAGRSAELREYGDRMWLVSDEHALSADSVAPDHMTGERIECSYRQRKFNYVALPLAPTASRAQGLEEVARYPREPRGWSGLTVDLAVQRPGLIVVARGADGLRWVEVAPERGAMAEAGRLAALSGDEYNDVAAINERYVAVASLSQGLVIVDAANPADPYVVVDTLPELWPMFGHSVFVSGSRLYLAQAPSTGAGAVVAFDVSDPEAPRQLWRWKAEPGDDAHDVTVRGDHIYVSSIRGGITLLDAAADEAPRVVGRRHGLAAHSCSIVDGARAPSGATVERLLWAEESPGGSLRLIDVERNAAGIAFYESPLLLQERVEGRPNTPAGFHASPHHSECDGEVCFVAHYQLGLRVIDLGKLGPPGQGTLSVPVLAEYTTWQPSVRGESLWLRGATGVALDLPWVYVADTEAGVVALRYDAATNEGGDAE